ncbi:TAXI family TRAP transporter solute-binding subunit [Vallitalea guaymasensis]|uniref:TAXI family TRAP transporter solute-binding subunit n=1 Tax=Vallitalea guaymasensis TaxID=1185412 RepID=A0A8J8MA86_9FIRM|nr:TAXI family TRAP transporter solute-binding subunit [Vallitalea guaymasensis]QUH29237.1 TAXI family TRAP transporter solute-binding subunit [Vallitalea guaymasensis]
MKKNKVLSISVIVVLLFAMVTGCSNTSKIKRCSLGSGSVGGTFYLMGGGITTLINKYLPDNFMYSTETTGGSTANLGMLQKGDVELGIAMTSSVLGGYQGSAAWTNGVAHDKVRGMIALYPSSMTIYALADMDIETLKDLNGKTVGLGSKGAAMDTTLRIIFDEMGIKPSAIHNDGHSATAKAVADGVIDCAITFMNPPWPAIMEIEGTKDLKFIALTEDEQNKIMDIFDFYSKSVIKKGAYKGVKEDTLSLNEWNFLCTSSDISVDEIYIITKTIYENQADLLAIHHAASNIVPENNIYSPIPLHGGVVKYMEEVGIDVPSELIPDEYTKE